MTASVQGAGRFSGIGNRESRELELAPKLPFDIRAHFRTTISGPWSDKRLGLINNGELLKSMTTIATELADRTGIPPGQRAVRGTLETDFDFLYALTVPAAAGNFHHVSGERMSRLCRWQWTGGAGNDEH